MICLVRSEHLYPHGLRLKLVSIRQILHLRCSKAKRPVHYPHLVFKLRGYPLFDTSCRSVAGTSQRKTSQILPLKEDGRVRDKDRIKIFEEFDVELRPRLRKDIESVDLKLDQ